MAIVVGLVYGLKERDIVGSFLSGAGDLISIGTKFSGAYLFT